jgi:hypothetical protein
MLNAFGILGGIALIAWIIVLLDCLGRRKERQSRERLAPRSARTSQVSR